VDNHAGVNTHSPGGQLEREKGPRRMVLFEQEEEGEKRALADVRTIKARYREEEKRKAVTDRPGPAAAASFVSKQRSKLDPR